MDQIQERMKKLREKTKEFLGKFSKRTKKLILILLIAVLIVAIVLAAVLNHTDYVVLFSGITDEESTEILAKLSELQVEYKYSGNGDILVDSAVADSTRATLAYEGYPKSGFTYDVFKDNVGGMTTDSESQTYKLYDLQNRIGATVRLFEGVKDARVTIALGNEQKYVLDDSATKPSASVVVITKTGHTLSARQAEGIQRLVAHSVPGMEMDSVSVLDETGVEISTSDGGSGDLGDEIAQIIEGQITRKVWNVLEPFFGGDNIRVSTNAKINMEKIIRESITYTTPDKIDKEDKDGIVSHEEKDVEASGIGNTAGGVVGTEENSDIPQYVAGAINSDDGYYSNIINRDYLVNQVKEQGELASGAVEDITVSVSLNKGSQESVDLDSLRELIGNAAGIAADDRDDKITVFIAPFYDDGVIAADPGSIIQYVMKSKYFPFIAIGLAVLLIILILVIILVRKKAKKKGKKGKKNKNEEVDIVQPVELSDAEKQEILNMQNERSRGLRENVREFADNNPEIAAHMIRDWLRGGEDSGEE